MRKKIIAFDDKGNEIGYLFVDVSSTREITSAFKTHYLRYCKMFFDSRTVQIEVG